MVEKQEDVVEDVEEVIEDNNSNDGGSSKKGPKPVPYTKFAQHLKINRALTGDLAEMTANYDLAQEEITSYKLKIKGLSEVKSKLDKWESDRLTEKRNKWSKTAEIFSIDDGDKNFEKYNKIKDKFTFKTEDTKLTTEQIDKNFELYNTYNEIDYFEGATKKKDDTTKVKTTTTAKESEDDFYGYGSKIDLASNDPKKWKLWKKNNPGK